MFYSQNKKKTLYGVFLFVLCAFILVFTAPTAKASNNYIDNISFYKNVDGFNHIKFFVKTTFVKDTNEPFVRLYLGSSQTWPYYFYLCPDNPATYTAGNTYDKILYKASNCSGLKSTEVYNSSYYLYFITAGFPVFNPSWFDTEHYYFSEFPTLDIYYPQPNAEISGAFDMTGLYTLPAGSPYDTLLAMVNQPGISDATYYGFFQMNLPPDWWDVVIRVAGVPAGEYEIFFAFMDYDNPDDVYISPVSIPITIVVGSPSEFEPGEIPPSIFNILDPVSYYTANSNYASSTLVFDNLSGAIKPVVLKIGDYLTFFSSKFDPETAKETGEAMAGGVLIVRAYADNLNTFFGDLPISQALFFYLLLLVVVAVFRIVKNLINLIKP